jgi:glycerol-3-phosphate cytidylyltransferase-like family protein
MADFDLLNLEETKINSSMEGKVVLLYGSNNVGKSKVSSLIYPHQTLFIATEKGYNALGGARVVDTLDWNTFRQLVKQLTNKKTLLKMHEKYKAVVVDVADRLPEMCSAYICDKNSINALSDMPYGQGYSQQKNEFNNQINKLALSGYLVILICHDETNDKYTDPVSGDEYPYTFPKNTMSKAGAPLKDIPDFCIYLQNNGTDDEGEVILSTGIVSHRKNVFARARFTKCATTIEPFTAENLIKTVREACIAEAKELGVECIDEFDINAVIHADDNKEEEKQLTHGELVKRVNEIGKKLYKDYASDATAVIERYLGEGVKVAKTTEAQNDKLQFIINDLSDFAEKVGIDID